MVCDIVSMTCNKIDGIRKKVRSCLSVESRT